MIKTLQFAAILCTAIALVAGGAHLLELPAKMDLSRDSYLIVQQIYRGWAFVGIAVVGALVSGAALVVLQRHRGAPIVLPLIATVCIAATLAIFFSFTYPANSVTHNWTVMPVEGWESLRRQWEYSHAASAVLHFVALASLVLSSVLARE